MGLPKPRYAIAEYLEMEEKAVDRHEYHDGEILAMSGGTYAHSKVCVNLIGELRTRLRGSPCEPLDSNMRVRVISRRVYLYPDVSIVCGGPQFDVDDLKKTTITNPRVVIEVLSESTESYDRSGKFDFYRDIESLEEYILISQQQPLIDSYLRQAHGDWLLRPFKGLESLATIRSLSLSIPLTEIYAGVEFDDQYPGLRVSEGS